HSLYLRSVPNRRESASCDRLLRSRRKVVKSAGSKPQTNCRFKSRDRGSSRVDDRDKPMSFRKPLRQRSGYPKHPSASEHKPGGPRLLNTLVRCSFELVKDNGVVIDVEYRNPDNS